MCRKKIKQWKMWNWRVFQWKKSALRWIKWLFTHKYTKKTFSVLSDIILFLLIVTFAFGLVTAIASGLYFANKPNLSYQHGELDLNTNDYFLITYNLQEEYIWDIELIIDTPNANFRVYILPTDSINFVGDVPYSTGIQGYYSINHESYRRIRYEIPSTDTWSCLVVNYEVNPAQFDIEMDIITTSQWVVNVHNAVKTISDYWLIPIFTVTSLVFILRELSKKNSENKDSTNDQTTTNPP